MFKLSFLLRFGWILVSIRYLECWLKIWSHIFKSGVRSPFEQNWEFFSNDRRTILKNWLHIRNKVVWKFERRLRWWNWTCPHSFLPKYNFLDAVQIFTAKFISNFAKLFTTSSFFLLKLLHLKDYHRIHLPLFYRISCSFSPSLCRMISWEF